MTNLFIYTDSELCVNPLDMIAFMPLDYEFELCVIITYYRCTCDFVFLYGLIFLCFPNVILLFNLYFNCIIFESLYISYKVAFLCLINIKPVIGNLLTCRPIFYPLSNCSFCITCFFFVSITFSFVNLLCKVFKLYRMFFSIEFLFFFLPEIRRLPVIKFLHLISFQSLFTLLIIFHFQSSCLTKKISLM